MPKGISTLQNKSLRAKLRVHGYRARKANASPALAHRRAKGRRQLTPVS